MSYQPISLTIPNRKPFVRGYSFLDGKGPPPADFLDETQDHLSALLQSRVGSTWSLFTEDFGCYTYAPSYLGKFRVSQNAGTGKVLYGPTTSSEQGEHGVYTLTLQPGTALFEMQSADASLGHQDFLFSAKVKLLHPELLDPFASQGFHLSMGPKVANLPGFAAGSDSPNWQVFTPLSEVGSASYVDSGIPILQGKYYLLQWGRFQGGLRFLINQHQIPIPNDQGLLLPGVFYPNPMVGAKAYLTIRRSVLLALSSALCTLDFFHFFLRRG